MRQLAKLTYGRDPPAATQRAESNQRDRGKKACRRLGSGAYADIIEERSAAARGALARKGQHSARRCCCGIEGELHVIANGRSGSIEKG